MKRILATFAVLAISLPALAEQSGRPPPKPQPKATPLSKQEQQYIDVQNAKARFMAAVGSCTRPETCDPTSPARNPETTKMLQEAEDAFMEACVQCASDKGCEAEKARIREGKGRYGYNVCVVEASKGSGKKSGSSGTKAGSGGGSAGGSKGTAPAAPKGPTGPSK